MSATLVSCQQMPGILAGKNAPAFQARDQFGKKRTLSSLMEPNGLVLLFFRSADW
jgi:peroxiredoxin